jgi:hypothetical protein
MRALLVYATGDQVGKGEQVAVETCSKYSTLTLNVIGGPNVVDDVVGDIACMLVVASAASFCCASTLACTQASWIEHDAGSAGSCTKVPRSFS